MFGRAPVVPVRPHWEAISAQNLMKELEKTARPNVSSFSHLSLLYRHVGLNTAKDIAHELNTNLKDTFERFGLLLERISDQIRSYTSVKTRILNISGVSCVNTFIMHWGYYISHTR